MSRMESPEREWFLDDRLKKLDHLANSNLNQTIVFKKKNGQTDAIFPDELESMAVFVGGSLFQDIDEQGEGQFAGEVLVGQKRYGREYEGFTK